MASSCPFDFTFVAIHKTNERVGRVGSQAVCPSLFQGFLDGLTLDPLQPAQSKHSSPFSEPSPKSYIVSSMLKLFFYIIVPLSMFLVSLFKLDFEWTPLEALYTRLSQEKKNNAKGVVFRCPFWIGFENFVLTKAEYGACWLTSRFSLFFPRFPERPDPPSAAACAVETEFSIFGAALKQIQCLHNF